MLVHMIDTRKTKALTNKILRNYDESVHFKVQLLLSFSIIENECEYIFIQKFAIL